MFVRWRRSGKAALVRGLALAPALAPAQAPALALALAPALAPEETEERRRRVSSEHWSVFGLNVWGA